MLGDLASNPQQGQPPDDQLPTSVQTPDDSTQQEGQNFTDKIDTPVPDDLTQQDQKEYLAGIKKRNKYLLMGMTKEERKRVANYIIDLKQDSDSEHEIICQKVDEWDEVSRLLRKEVIGSQGELPNYRMPLTLLTHEVVHSNIMNVFFSPQDPMRVIPTAEDDVMRVNNISVFGNWSMKNELDLFVKFDEMNHASIKNGESVAMIYWKKEYGVEIKRIPVKDEKGNVVYDEETQEPIFQEKEVPKLIYNAPVMEVLNRKDYYQPKDCLMGDPPEWEACIRRMSYDSYLRDETQGKFYEGSIQEIQNWPATEQTEVEKTTYDGDNMMVSGWEKEFFNWYGRMRVTIVEEGIQENEAVKVQELEDEFICIVHIKSRTLCAMRKNRFPMKMRPFVNDYFQPDDTGRRAAIGVYELMDSLQKCYDAVFNQYVYGVELSNNPIVFFTPTGNMRDERFKIEKGYAYPTSDANSVKIFQFPAPNDSMRMLMDLIQQWAQFMYGISDYAAGMQSDIDPQASGKKVQMIIDQGNVRLNLIIKRKQHVLKEIFKRWFLLYRDNMPPNKFMRIAGEENDPWKFQSITYEDFSLQSIPDFELTGNVLNANKQLEANKAIAVFQMMMPLFMFNPATTQGQQKLTQLAKWLVDKIGDAQLSNLMGGTDDAGTIMTPEEENGLMLQGDEVEPHQGEDVQHHIKVHLAYMSSPQCPEQIKPLLASHIKKTIEMFKMLMAQKIAIQNSGMPNMGPTPPQGPQNSPAAPTPGRGTGNAPAPPFITNRPRVGNGMPINRTNGVNRVGTAGATAQPGNAIPQ